ncbi:MAG: hypothetical protein RMX68_019005 [Aulosira sp. ZfuVER01]
MEFIRRSRGFDFTAYTCSSLMLRIRKPMFSLQIETFNEYLH